MVKLPLMPVCLDPSPSWLTIKYLVYEYTNLLKGMFTGLYTDAKEVNLTVTCSNFIVPIPVDFITSRFCYVSLEILSSSQNPAVVAWG